MYKQNAVSPVLALPRLDDGRGAWSYGAMLMVALLLHAALALFLSRPVRMASVAPSINNPNPETVTVTDIHNAPGPVDVSYPPKVLDVLQPDPGPGPGGPGNGPANDVQAKVNMGGLVMEGGSGDDVLKIGGKQASLDSLLVLQKTGGGGNGHWRIGVRAKPEPPTVPFVSLQVRPKLVDAPVPVYPEVARNAGIEGSAVVEALLNLDGSVMDARVLQSSGNQMLDAAAVEAALRARFTPAMQRDKPVRVWISMPYRFRLTN
jgi:TonB family protein